MTLRALRLSFVPLTKVLVVMDEVWQLPLLVDGLAGRADAVGERAGAAAEHAHFAHLKRKTLRENIHHGRGIL